MLKLKNKVAETNSEKTNDKNKRSIRFKIISAGVLAFVLIVCSVAWFTMDKYNDLRSVEMSSAEVPFEIKTVGTADYENKDILDLLGYSQGNITDDSNSTSSENSKVYWLMNDESNINNNSVDSEGISPGSYGKLTFYIVPKKDGDMEFTFNLDMKGYKTVDEKLEIISDKNVTDFLKGHIMFFEGYDDTTKCYSKHIVNGQFNHKINNAQKGKEYPVTIYWIWPNTIGQLLLTKNDININGADPIFEGKSNDKSNFGEFLSQNYNLYFDTTKNTNLLENGKFKSEYSEAINNMVANKEYKTKYLTDMNSAYNDADEEIGTTVEDLVLELKAVCK